ncbi:transposon factor [Moniliophthora roreri MCA 2997]|uniref:Transposon factor n=1 Tax=Moniliophthora roreri (strain MCA 2997) TaxID=1381753 RepID=V2WQ91_MONRO|nr:transposon factor [Moniliophthora roreri MCA 2997]
MQTQEHIIQECPLYELHREALRDVSRDIAVPEIVGTDKGVRVLSEFLTKSGAFTFHGRPWTDEIAPRLEDVPLELDEDDVGWDDGG